ncbi:MAG: DUF3568 family protein [Lentisphaeria bacterium]|nr:DUF3568 family protein [Lentisphaeria bacterium]
MKTLKSLKMSALALTVMLLNTGCVVFLSAVAAGVTVWYYSGENGTTAEVTIQKPAVEVYEALLKAVVDAPEMKLLTSDSEEMEVTMSKGKKTAKAVVEKVEGDKSALLRVTADDGTDKEDIDNVLAMKIITQVCDDLDVKYELKSKDKE